MRKTHSGSICPSMAVTSWRSLASGATTSALCWRPPRQIGRDRVTNLQPGLFCRRSSIMSDTLTDTANPADLTLHILAPDKTAIRGTLDIIPACG